MSLRGSGFCGPEKRVDNCAEANRAERGRKFPGSWSIPGHSRNGWVNFMRYNNLSGLVIRCD